MKLGNGLGKQVLRYYLITFFMKKLTCRDIGIECDIEFLGETDDEIMHHASEHAKKEHNLPIIPPSIEAKCRVAISDVVPNV